MCSTITQELQAYRKTHIIIKYHTTNGLMMTKSDAFFNDHISFFVTPYQRKHLDMDGRKYRLLSMLLNVKDENN